MSRNTAPRHGVSVRTLLLTVNGLVLVVPILMFLSVRLFQSQLVRQTETKLIAESVLIGEIYRELLAEEQGLPGALHESILPPDAPDGRFAPIQPVLGEDYRVGPPLPQPQRFMTERDGPAWRAGLRLQGVLERAQLFNLTSARVTNEQGVVVASSGTWLGAVLDKVPEVSCAIAGRYAAETRTRISDEPKPSLSSISSRGDVRVFTATPIFAGGRVIGTVWMSRTSMDPLKAAWLSRRPLLTALLCSVLITLAVSLVLSRQILRPLRHITRAAQAIARGSYVVPLAPGGRVPAEIHRLSQALTSMQAQLSDRADSISEFAANVSHELKSPITSIRGAAELLREEAGEMSADQRERFLQNVESDAARMERLVTRLLELARIQNQPEVAQSIAVGAFLERIAGTYGGKVVLTREGEPDRLEMVPDHLESAVRCLLDNAVRHGADRPVDLIARRQGERLVLLVRDRGAGISEANQKMIFQRFFTTERDRGGTGLGLSIVQAVARTRGGTVTFTTGQDGTTFTLVV